MNNSVEAVVVEKKYCNKIKIILQEQGFYNEGYKCLSLCGEYIAIPLHTNSNLGSEEIVHKMNAKQLGDLSFELGAVPFRIKTVTFPKPKKINPSLKLKSCIIFYIKSNNVWTPDLESEIPNSWEKYGDIVLFNGDKFFKNIIWFQLNNEIWKMVCSILKVNRIGIKSRISCTDFRIPQSRLLFGNSTVIDYIDNGIHYRWDLIKNMFSAGNAPERHRISKFTCKNEVVVDMYAGIGYFTIPYLVHAQAKMVYACEWNSQAVKMLKYNLQINNVSNRCVIYEGDNRIVCPENIADRVNLGFLPSCEAGWRTACTALKSDTGGILHIHGNVSHHLINGCVADSLCSKCSLIKSKLEDVNFNSFYLDSNFVLYPLVEENVSLCWKKKEWREWAIHVVHCIYDIISEIRSGEWKVCLKNVHFVKSYAPHIDHIVLDIQCIKK